MVTQVEPFIKEVDGELKIHEFEKHYITHCLKKEVENTENWVSTIDPSLKEAAEKIGGTYLRDIKAVLERVEAMPSTRW